MSTETKTKTCKDCGLTKPLEDYYKHRANTYRSMCKPCYRIYRKQYPNNSSYIPRGKRKNGFERLPIETQTTIKQDIKNMTAKEVALKYDLNLNTLNTWKRRGFV